MKVKIENKEYNIIDNINDIKIKSIDDITNLANLKGIQQTIKMVEICSNIPSNLILKLNAKSLNEIINHITPILNKFSEQKKISKFTYKGLTITIKDMEELSVGDIITIEQNQKDLLKILNIILDFDTAIDRIDFINDLPAYKLLQMINTFFLSYQK